MRTIIAHGVDLERLEAAAEYLTAFEIEFLTDADKACKGRSETFQDAATRNFVAGCRQDARECRDHAQVVRDAAEALERLEESDQ